MRLLTLLILTASLLCAPLHVEAAFFMRLRGSTSRQLETMGGQRVYRTTARINGAPAKLEVFGFGSSPRDVGDELRRLWQLPPIPTKGPAWLTRAVSGKLSHLLILPGVRLSDATVWLIEPEKATSLPRGANIPDPPAANPCPAAELRYWIVNDQTHSLFLIYRTPEAPSIAIDIATASLTADAWQEQMRTDSLVVLARDGRMALALATRTLDTPQTQLAVFMQGAATTP